MQLTVRDCHREVKVANLTDPRRAFSAVRDISGRCTRRFRLTYRSRTAPGLRSPPTTSATAIWRMRACWPRRPDAIRTPGEDVREFLPLLEQERWYTQTENGYARGWEPVRYVDNVRGYGICSKWALGQPAPARVALN